MSNDSAEQTKQSDSPKTKSIKFVTLMIIGLVLVLVYAGYILFQNPELKEQLVSLRNIVVSHAPFDQININTELTQDNENEPSQKKSTVSNQLDASNSSDNHNQKKIYHFTAYEDGQTPFSLLVDGYEIEYDQYDLGVFVTSIEDQQATNEYYWAVFVNGEYVQEASDKIVLSKGDRVEWRWEEVEAFEELE